MSDIGTVFGTGGPVLIGLSVLAWIAKFWTDKRTGDRDAQTNAPKNAAEADSAVVSATKEVVSLVRAELTAAGDQIAGLRKEKKDVEDERDMYRAKLQQAGRELMLADAENENLTRQLSVTPAHGTTQLPPGPSTVSEQPATWQAPPTQHHHHHFETTIEQLPSQPTENGTLS